MDLSSTSLGNASSSAAAGGGTRESTLRQYEFPLSLTLLHPSFSHTTSLFPSIPNLSMVAAMKAQSSWTPGHQVPPTKKQKKTTPPVQSPTNHSQPSTKSPVIPSSTTAGRQSSSRSPPRQVHLMSSSPVTTPRQRSSPVASSGRSSITIRPAPPGANRPHAPSSSFIVPSSAPGPSSSQMPTASGSSALDGDVNMGESGRATSVEGEGDGEEDEVDNEVGAGSGDEEGEDGDENEEGEGEDDEDDDEDDDEEDDEDSEEEDDDEVILLEEGLPRAPSIQVKPEPGDPTVPAVSGADGSSAAGPSTDTATADAEGETVNTLVPKKKKQRRRAPSVDLPPPPPPMKTIRLEVKLGVPGGDDYRYDVLEDARRMGMVAGHSWKVEEEDPDAEDDERPTRPAGGGIGALVNGIGGDLDDEEAQRIAREIEERYKEPAKKKAVKRKPIDYDISDPFIDDSELQKDAPTHFERTAKEGFFVHQGVVELERVSPQKPARRPAGSSKRVPRSSQANTTAQHQQRKSLAQIVTGRTKKLADGSRLSPIKIDSEDETDRTAGPSSSPYLRTPSPDDLEDTTPLPVDRALFASASKELHLLPPFPTFPKELRQALMKLREESLNYKWNLSAKGKFPEELKKSLKDAGRAAFRNTMFDLGEDDEGRFFHALPSILPYNKYTLMKLMTKSCYAEYLDFLRKCEDEGLHQLRSVVRKHEEDVIRKYEEAYDQYLHSKRAWDLEHPSDVATNGNTHPSVPQDAPTGDGADANGNDEDENPTAVPGGAPKPPKKVLPWTSEIREVFEQLMDNLQKMCDLHKRAIEYRVSGVEESKEWTETNMRPVLYKKVVEQFPKDYCNTAIVSREMSKAKAKNKKKVTRAAQEADA